MSKLKELQRRSTMAWSVSAGRPDLLAAGTMAGTVGLDFDTSAQLEIFSLSLDDPSSSLSLVGKTTSANMFHKIVWGQSANGKYGILAGGMDNGAITIWDPEKISTEAGLIGNAQKHKGPVQALDFNPFQQNLLASGATDSEIFIWDLGKPSDPTVYTPGAKPQQASDIANVAWNKKVQHILASTQFSGLTVIWDLKAKKPVINFADRNSKARAKSIAWHPSEATQIIAASDEDEAPVLQMWDLRNVYTPVRTFHGHTKGVWGVSWSPFDSSLILSCGKDNRTLAWHVETAEVLCEVESGSDPSTWNFDVQWSPRIPAILSTSSLEGKVSIYALQDVCERAVVSGSIDGLQVQSGQTTQTKPTTYKHTPGWLQRPCGVAFGFGGKLASFGRTTNSKTDPKNGPNPAATPAAPISRTITISSVVTEKDIINRSERLEEVINAGNFSAFCEEKITSAPTEEEKSTWSFLRVLFDTDARHKILNYLGFDEAKTQQEIKDFIATLPEDTVAAAETPRTPTPPPKTPSPPPQEERESEKEKESEEASVVEDTTTTATTDAIDATAAGGDNKDVSGLFGAGGDGEEFSFEQQQHHDHERLDHPHHDDHSHSHDHSHDHAHDHSHDHAHDHSHHHKEAVKPVEPAKKKYNGPPISIPTSDFGPESAITKALLIGNFEAAVQCCLRLDRVADALILAASGGPELWARTQEAYFARQTHSYARVMSAVVRNDLEELVEHSALSDWKATLATLCTYTKSADFPRLCSALGDRLDVAEDAKAAILCYICAGSIDKTVSIWVRTSNTQKNPHLVLQDLVEKIAIFRQAVGDRDDLNDLLASKYSEYAEILASQGKVTAALRYLSFLNDPKYSNTRGAVLLDRVYHNSFTGTKGNEPLFPFKRVGVYPQGQQPVQSQQQQPVRAPVTAPTQTPYGAPLNSYATPTNQYSTPTAPTYGGANTGYPPQYSTPSAYGTPSGSSFSTPATSTFTPQPTSSFQTTNTSSFAPPPTNTFNVAQNISHSLPKPTHGTHSSDSPTVPPSYPTNTVAPPPTVFTPAPPSTAPTNNPLGLPPTGGPFQQRPNVMTPVAPPSPVVNNAPAPPPPSELPPAGSFSRSGAPSSAAPAAAAPSAATSADVAFVISSLQSHIDAVIASTATDPANKAKVDNMAKRLKPLLDRLQGSANPALTPGSVDALHKLATALNNRATSDAQAILVQLSTSTTSADLGPAVVIGLKHLISLCK